MWVLVDTSNYLKGPEYVSGPNPKTTTLDIREAQRFRTIESARAVKKAFGLWLRIAPKRIPDWMT